MFLHDKAKIEYMESLTKNPSEENIKAIVDEISMLLPDDGSIDAEIELIAMGVEPVHPGITEKLRNSVSSE